MTSRTSQKVVRRTTAEMRREIARRDRRRRQLTLIAVAGAAAVLGTAMIVAAVVAGRSSEGDAAIATVDELAVVSGLGAEALPPWPAPADVPARVAAAGLPLGPEGTAEHYHVHLDVIVDGQAVPVPANIGVDPATGAMAELHTHEPNGLVHIEAAEQGKSFTLGQLFTEWDVRLTADQVGGLEAGDGKTLEVYVNGAEVVGNPATVRLASHQEIAIVYGPAGQDLDVPDSYDFAPGD